MLFFNHLTYLQKSNEIYFIGIHSVYIMLIFLNDYLFEYIKLFFVSLSENKCPFVQK